MVCFPSTAASVRNRDISRLSLAFGFLASKEVKDAGIGNLGLHDRQSEASFPPVRSELPDRP